MLAVIVKVIVTIFSVALFIEGWKGSKAYPWEDRDLSTILFEIGCRSVVVLIFCLVVGGMWFEM